MPARAVIYWFFAHGSADIAIKAGGSVTGSTGIFLSVPLNARDLVTGMAGSIAATVDNAGTIEGTAGAALIADEYSSIASIRNRAGGVIDGIEGRVGKLNNAGTINGAHASALLIETTSPIRNSGLITSAGDSATIVSRMLYLKNSGTVSATGNGVTLDTVAGTITNAAGGTIAAACGIAIRAASSLTLHNGGTIDGSIIIHSDSWQGSVIDQSGGGSIHGDGFRVRTNLLLPPVMQLAARLACSHSRDPAVSLSPAFC